MDSNHIGGLYGKEGEFFGQAPKTFKNYVWIELIGFDNTKKDFGIPSLLDTMGFKPDGFFLLVTSIDIINMHAGMSSEYELHPYFCSYGGPPYNDERKRQRWTNLQLKALTEVLHTLKIESYISIFDFTCPDSTFRHPELCTTTWQNGKQKLLSSIYMTKRFADGSFYEDFFAAAAVKFLRDYAFDGIHLADGVCRPRLPLQSSELSDDMLEQAGIQIPEGVSRDTYIAEHKRQEWLAFCAERWGKYLKKVISKISGAGFKVVLNSTWTKDPMEAYYRYGIDYRQLKELPIDLFVAENGAPTISIIDNEANAGYKQSYEDRKLQHHLFRASLILTAACMGAEKLIPLYPVRDTAEQYDVIHHLPTALPKHSAAIFSSFLWEKDGLRPIISGNTFCLGDGLSRDNWRYLRLCSDNAYIKNIKSVPGATLIWSDARNKAEISALISHRTPSTHRLLSLLLRQGAAVFKTAHIDNLMYVQGDILVTNPQLMPEEELKKIKEYQNGRVIYLAAETDNHDYSKEQNPVGVGFPFPLYFSDASEEQLASCTAEINRGLSYISEYKEACRVQEIEISKGMSRFIITSDEYYYTRPVIHTGRKIKSVTDITKPAGYQAEIDGDTFSLLVPLMGAAIAEVEFESP